MTHTVKAGETLGGIANQHGTNVTTLVRLNPTISDPNRITVGQTINLPATNPREHCAVGQIQSESGCAPEPFELAFYWNDRPQARNEIYTDIFGETMNFRLRSLFDRNNEHLRETVFPGEIVIVSSMPVSAQDREKLARLKEQARLASSGIQQLSPEEAATVKRHIQTLDFVSIEGAAASQNSPLERAASHQSAALGVLSAAAGQRLNSLGTILENLNTAYIEELTRNPSGRRLSPEFLAKRSQLFAELDHALNRVTMSSLNIRQYDKVKNTLGLSTKSILHNASEIVDNGQVPGLGQRIKTVSAWARGSSYLGWFGIAIDGGVRTSRIVEACQTGDAIGCRRVSFRQVGGFTFSAGGGAMGGYAGAKVFTAAAGGLALVFGVTLGAPVVAIIAITGAAIGALAGGSQLGDFGEFIGEFIHDTTSR